MVRYTLEYNARVTNRPDLEWIKGTMTVEADTEAAAKVKATNAIRMRFRQYGMKIGLKVLNQQDVI